jgi:N-acetylglucosamine-6-phosphate deacetylase
MTIDCTGKSIYAGLIDAWGETEVPKSTSQAAYWNSNVTPERSAADVASKAADQAAKFRSAGFTTRVVAPQDGIVKGSSCVVLMSDAGAGRTLLKEKAWQHLQLSVPRGGSRPRYPNSPMGAVALVRQAMYDANWYREAWDAYRARGDLSRPETNLALDVLSKSIEADTFVIDAPNERMAIRAGNIAREFSLKMIVRGSGREYRQLDEIAAMNRPILVPVDFPDVPSVKTTESERRTTLQDLMHWDLAPENPARLVAAGVPI